MSRVFMDTMFGALPFLSAFVSFILSFSNGCGIDEDIFSVIDYGATSDGYTDNSKAFLEAWDAACSSIIDYPRVYVPPDGTFLLNPVTFQGPCNALRISFVISGVLVAPDSPSLWDGMDASQCPNTDGIHIQSSQQVTISNSTISCGDDCISIGDHISDIEICRVECGPDHGISPALISQLRRSRLSSSADRRSLTSLKLRRSRLSTPARLLSTYRLSTSLSISPLASSV
ncbi:Pectin lyase-like superfamily protein [Striga hermonthica]|uniref:Pectin lyase-like superfamily protein n=1 Tax=Striga hermonthica TaxID=68872 RepID=A0A9N7MMI0_STRHE|nr:Pectin lyase-like superfamily protein [Striga hermonthica]